jgi:hypothetical protein
MGESLPATCVPAARGGGRSLVAAVVCAGLAAAGALAAQPLLPPVPGEPEPGAPPAEEPALGLEGTVGQPARRGRTFDEWLDDQLAAAPFPLHGYLDLRGGVRYLDDRHQPRDATLGEVRLQLESDPYLGPFGIGLKADFLYDGVLDELAVDWREANFAVSPVGFMDVKVGRQVLTWGTGDLVFLNDLFPKDYESFFIGRHVEYLKAPSDAVKASVFSEAANLDVVYTPHFDPDVYITGQRLSYYNPVTGIREGEDVRVRAQDRESWFSDDELALRLYRTVGSYELACYAYQGFWKSPAGMKPSTGKVTFPELGVYGASMRGPHLGGIGNAEVAYYDSMDDRGGDDPFVRNGEWRFLIGHTRELRAIAPEFTVGVQYYLEHADDYRAYRRALPPDAPAADENRHMLTVRLTKMLMAQDMEVSVFTFWSPSDKDVYVRPHVTYDVTDRWRVEAGANVFAGSERHTQFGQLHRNSNVYAGLRYSF